MKFYDGSLVEIVLAPSNAEMEVAIQSARQLMAKKLDQWILDRLTMDQLRNVLVQVGDEIKKRQGPKERK